MLFQTVYSEMAGKVIDIVESEPILAGTVQQEEEAAKKMMFHIEVVESWRGELKASKFKQVLVTMAVRSAIISITEYGYGTRTLWKCDASWIAKILAKAVGDKLDLPIQMEVRKKEGDIAHLHIALGEDILYYCTI